MLEDFLKYQAKTTPHPLGLEIAKANGNYLYDTDGKSYLDFIAGVSACPLGHSHPNVIKQFKIRPTSICTLWFMENLSSLHLLNFAKN